MKHINRQAMALTFCAVGLFAGSALSNSLHDEGDFGGGYEIIGPSGGPERYDYVQKHTFRPYNGGPTLDSYDPPVYDLDAPDYYAAPVVVAPDYPGGY